MFYLIYKITNILNGYIYIGQHTTDIINDGYMGSGIRLINAYKKQHKLAFDKKIVCYNNDNSIKFEFWGSKIDFLKTFNCPDSVWNAAIKQTVFQSNRKGSKEFNGCSFTLIKWKP